MNKDNVSEIIRLATSKKPSRIDIQLVDIDPTLNVREPNMDTWDIPSIADDLALSGQKEPVLLERRGDRFLPWRGFRRTAGVKFNADRGIIDPATGQKFAQVLAFVIDQELSEKERISLLLDAGNTRALNKTELFYSVEKADKVWDTDAQIAIAVRGLLDIHYPVRDPDVTGDPVKYADYRRGVIGNLLNAARSPVVVRDQYVLRLKKKQSWPSDAEIRPKLKLFRKEMDADKSRKINRQNPGPEFMKEWDEFVSKKRADELNDKKPRALNMMTQDDVSGVQEKLDSRTAKVLLDIVRRRISQEHLATLDELLVDAEAGRTTAEAFAAVLDTITASQTAEQGTPDTSGK